MVEDRFFEEQAVNSLQSLALDFAGQGGDGVDNDGVDNDGVDRRASVTAKCGP